MDFKWKLSRPGIELEFETGSIGEAIGMLEEEGTKISEVFGFTMASRVAPEAAPEATPPKERKQRATKEAVAPPPLAVPSGAVSPVPPSVTLPPNALMAPPADGGIPPGLKRDPVTNEAPALLSPALASPPIAPLAPLPPPPGPPPVGVLGPKVVAALDALRVGKADDGMPLSDWLAASGLTQKGAAYDDACRAVLMISDEKLKGVAEALKVS